MNPIFSGVAQYVDENRELIYGKIMLSLPHINEFSLEPTNAKGGKLALNLLSVAPVIGDGTQCSVNPGTATISQRMIELASLQTATPYCLKQMYPYFASLKVRLGETADESAYAEAFVNAEVTKINKALETMIWQGVKSATSCEGIATIIQADGTNAASAGTTLYAKINDLRLAAQNAGVENVVVALGADKFYALADEINARNFYHVAVTTRTDGSMEFELPLTSVKVWGIKGLNATSGNVALAFDPANIHYGYAEEVGIGDIKWAVDEVNDIAYLKTAEVLGCQVAFPGETYYQAI